VTKVTELLFVSRHTGISSSVCCLNSSRKYIRHYHDSSWVSAVKIKSQFTKIIILGKTWKYGVYAIVLKLVKSCAYWKFSSSRYGSNPKQHGLKSVKSAVRRVGLLLFAPQFQCKFDAKRIELSGHLCSWKINGWVLRYPVWDSGRCEKHPTYSVMKIRDSLNFLVLWEVLPLWLKGNSIFSTAVFPHGSSTKKVPESRIAAAAHGTTIPCSKWFWNKEMVSWRAPKKFYKKGVLVLSKGSWFRNYPPPVKS
jgi:hypothetical protein